MLERDSQAAWYSCGVVMHVLAFAGPPTLTRLAARATVASSAWRYGLVGIVDFQQLTWSQRMDSYIQHRGNALPKQTTR